MSYNYILGINDYAFPMRLVCISYAIAMTDLFFDSSMPLVGLFLNTTFHFYLSLISINRPRLLNHRFYVKK